MLGDIASIATLVLFFIYFIGRIITIAIEKNIKYESVDVYFNENQIPKNIKIIDEYKCSDDSKEILIITPTTIHMSAKLNMGKSTISLKSI